MRIDVRFLRGARAGQQLSLENTWPVKIGRHPDNHVAFDPEQDRLVSSFHAEIRLEPDGPILHDLGSANGTFVNQRRVTRVKLAGPLQVTFGDDGPRILIEVSEAAAASASPPAVQERSTPPPAAPATARVPAPSPSPPPARSSHLGLAVTLGVLLALVLGGGGALFWLRPAFLFGGPATAGTTETPAAQGPVDDEVPVITPEAVAPTVIDVPYRETRARVTAAAGGRLSVAEGLELRVPPGALTADTRLVVKRLEAPFHPAPKGVEPAGRGLGPVFDLGPDGISFKRPVRVTLAYDAERVPAGTPADRIRMVYFNGERWVVMPGKVDLAAHTVTAELTRFKGVALTTLLTAAVLVTGAVCWYKAYKRVTDPEWTASDPVMEGEANDWITPDDPQVRRYANRAVVQIEGTDETRDLDAPDLGAWLEKKYEGKTSAYGGNKARIAFRKGRRLVGFGYARKGANWQKPADHLTKGAEGRPLHGDCTDTTNTAVSVLQAKGFKARGVIGYSGGDKQRPHAWGEVVINGKPYFIDENGGLIPLDIARKELDYRVAKDPSDPRFRSTWDGKRQRRYDPNWHSKHAKKEEPPAGEPPTKQKPEPEPRRKLTLQPPPKTPPTLPPKRARTRRPPPTVKPPPRPRPARVRLVPPPRPKTIKPRPAARAVSGVYPARPFNGMQIRYTISGAALEGPRDSPGFTTSRWYKGSLGAAPQLTISGTVSQKNGYGASVELRVHGGGKGRSARLSLKVGQSKSFRLSAPIPPNSRGGSFHIDMTGHYNAGTRGLRVGGSLK